VTAPCGIYKNHKGCNDANLNVKERYEQANYSYLDLGFQKIQL